MVLRGEISFYLFMFDAPLISLDIQGKTEYLIYLCLNIFHIHLNGLLTILSTPGCFYNFIYT